LDVVTGDDIKLHRVHAGAQASRLQFGDPINLHWRGEGSRVSLGTKAAIAHRLAVCWNVCEGIPIAELESGHWRELTDAVFAGDLKTAQAVLAKMDSGTDTSDGRLHDCKQCMTKIEAE
jgi:hypothetical protein